MQFDALVDNCGQQHPLHLVSIDFIRCFNCHHTFDLMINTKCHFNMMMLMKLDTFCLCYLFRLVFGDLAAKFCEKQKSTIDIVLSAHRSRYEEMRKHARNKLVFLSLLSIFLSLSHTHSLFLFFLFELIQMTMHHLTRTVNIKTAIIVECDLDLSLQNSAR